MQASFKPLKIEPAFFFSLVQNIMTNIQKPKKPLFIDFDGVLHDHKNPVEGRKMGPPMEGAKKGIKILKLQKGFKIVIFSVRAGFEGGTELIAEWLKFYGIPYDEITAKKGVAFMYLDDHAVRFESWDHALEFVKIHDH